MVFNITEGTDDFLGKDGVNPILSRFLEGDGVDGRRMGGCCEVVIELGRYHCVKQWEGKELDHAYKDDFSQSAIRVISFMHFPQLLNYPNFIGSLVIHLAVTLTSST